MVWAKILNEQKYGKVSKGKLRTRKYRNRRTGELFKEIDLSEKQGIRISKILKEKCFSGTGDLRWIQREDI